MTAEAAFWNNIAEDYAKKPVENPDAFERKLAITKAQLRPEHVILDIGCGTGTLALRLAPCAAYVHGLDVSTEMLRIATDKARGQKVDNVCFHAGLFDESFTMFQAGSLDGVCAYNLLHLVDDRASALKRVFQLLKPGGFFVSSTACLGESWVPYRPLLLVMRALGKAPRVQLFSKRTLEDEVRRAGFIDIAQPDVGAKATIAFMVARKPV